MFDLSSAPPAPENKQGTSGDEVLVNLNLVLQRALQQVVGEDRSNIIIRCDELPFIPGSEADYQTAFYSLLQMILHQKDGLTSKLFLHIHCLPEQTETRNTKGFKWFTVQFNSNASRQEEWWKENEKRIEEIAAILYKNGGNLTVNQTKGSGCLFSLTVPGKNS